MLAVVIAAGAAAWFLTRNSSSNPAATTTTNTTSVTPLGPIAITPAALAAYSRTLGQPIYWVGPRRGYTYELTETSSAYVYVRYLPPGVRVGDKRANWLIIATYPFANAEARLKEIAHGGGATLPGGGFELPDASYPDSVHLAFPRENYEVEVYDPSPGIARAVAASGTVKPVAG